MDILSAIIPSLVTGILTLIGVIFTNISSNKSIENKLTVAQAVTDTKIDTLTEEVKKHNNFATRMPVVETEIKNINHRLDSLEGRVKGDDGK